MGVSEVRYTSSSYLHTSMRSECTHCSANKVALDWFPGTTRTRSSRGSVDSTSTANEVCCAQGHTQGHRHVLVTAAAI